MTIKVTAAQDAATVLAGLSSARTPWLTLALAGPADHDRFAAVAAAADDVTVVDITDPQAVPVMVNPFEPAPGYPIQARADRLAGLFEATFLEARLDALWTGPAGLFLEGGHPVGLVRLLRGNVLVTGGGLADEDARSFLVGVLLLRLAGQLSPRTARPFAPGGQAAGPDGRYQADRSRTVVVIAVPGRPPEPSRLPEPGQLPGPGRPPELARPPEPGQQPGPRHLPGPGEPAFPAGPGISPQQAAWFGRLLEDLRRTGTDVVVAAAGDNSPSAPRRPAGPETVATSPATGASGIAALLAGRRSAACGERCRRRPCTGYEVHAAALLADEPGQAWLRLWVRALVLAFLTSRPAPRVPAVTGSVPGTSPRRSTSAWPGCRTGRGFGSPTGLTGCGGTRWRWALNATAGSP